MDENEVWQSVPDTDTSWHCGAKTYRHNECRNSNAIGIEICSRKDSNGKYYLKADAVTKAILLTRELMTKYNIDANHVLRHYDVTGKNCPAPMVEDPGQWANFKKRLEVNSMAKDGNVPDSWAKEYVDWCRKEGLLVGDDKGNLNLHDNLTRQQMCVFMKKLHDKIVTGR